MGPGMLLQSGLSGRQRRTMPPCICRLRSTAMGQILNYYIISCIRHRVEFVQWWVLWKSICWFYNLLWLQWYGRLVTGQNYAVAELLYDCGVGADMQYSTRGSGAMYQRCSVCIKNFFNYHNAQHITRNNYSDNSWTNAILNENKQLPSCTLCRVSITGNVIALFAMVMTK